jgi:hypothetical protein
MITYHALLEVLAALANLMSNGEILSEVGRDEKSSR